MKNETDNEWDIAINDEFPWWVDALVGIVCWGSILGFLFLLVWNSGYTG